MPHYNQGQTVWIQNGWGAEKATVFVHDGEYVAVLIGPIEMGDRYIKHESEVYGEKSDVPRSVFE